MCNIAAGKRQLEPLQARLRHRDGAEFVAARRALTPCDKCGGCFAVVKPALLSGRSRCLNLVVRYCSWHPIKAPLASGRGLKKRLFCPTQSTYPERLEGQDHKPTVSAGSVSLRLNVSGLGSSWTVWSDHTCSRPPHFRRCPDGFRRKWIN